MSIRFPFRYKLGIGAALFSVLITSSSLYYFYTRIYETVWNQMAMRLQDAARSGVTLLSQDELQSLEKLKAELEKNLRSDLPSTKELPPGEVVTGLGEQKEEEFQSKEEFQHLVLYLRRVKNLTYLNPVPGGSSKRQPMNETNPNLIRYAYILAQIPGSEKDMVQFIADADYDHFDYNQNGVVDPSEEPTPPGTLFNVSEFKSLQKAFSGTVAADSAYTEDAWGVLISGYAPIKNSRGEVIGVLGLDMRADNEYNMVNDVFWLYILIVVLAAILSITLAIFLSRFLTRPLDTLRMGAERVMRKDFQTSIQLNTRDEMSMLAETFNNMVSEIRVFSENLQKQNEAFFRFVPNEFVHSLGGKSAVDINVGNSRSSRMSIMFTDIRSFTSFSEGRSPEDTFGFLNDYLGRMEPSIKAAGGFIDKFLGDGIMALFQAGESGVSAEERAVESAIRMRLTLADFNLEREQNHQPTIDFGVGIASGEVTLGTVGNQSRIDTTVIGAPVNLASRLEGLTALYRLPVLICEATMLSITDPDRFHIREVDTVIVRGSSAPLKIYEVYDADPESLRNCKDATRAQLSEGILAYKEARFDEALIIFQDALTICSGDRLLKIYISRCKKYIEKPPAGDWDGSIQITKK